MSVGKTFSTQATQYKRNYETGAMLRVVPAEIGTGRGSTPGVAIFKGRSHLFAVITTEHAWALADQLTDVLESLPDGNAS